jgi:GcrA cell cycle regulator
MMQRSEPWIWDDKRVERLKQLWADGLSASQIAADFGGITRNAVIGKVHRLGLSGRAKAPSSSAPRPRKARTASPFMRSPRPATRGNTALAPRALLEPEPEPELEMFDNVIPIGQRCSILQLTEATCHWPCGDPGSPEFFFCGGKAVNSPYCAYHARIAYQPIQDRRRDRRLLRA